MLARLTRWWHEQRQWHADHRAAWATARATLPDGLTTFQNTAEALIVGALRDANLALRNRNVARGSVGTYVEAHIPELGATVWIYENEVEIRTRSDRFHPEEWDAKTPDEYFALLRSYCGKLLSGRTEANS
jgi:hypothetical protein